MEAAKVDELMGLYIEHLARTEYLESEIKLLEQMLEKAKVEMVDDEVSLSQELTGMPHGSGVGDPVAILGMKLAEGHVSWRVEQITEELKKLRAEHQQKKWTVIFVNAWLKCLNDRERLLVEHKVLRGETWAEISEAYSSKYSIVISKSGMKKIIERAMEKIYTVSA